MTDRVEENAIKYLTFTRNRRVYWSGTHCGDIEPLTGFFRWGYVPIPGNAHVPNALRKPYFGQKQVEIKTALKRPFR